MKLRNAIVALGLVIAFTFGMNTSKANAHVLEPLQIEQVDGVIGEIVIGRSNNTMSMRVTCNSGSLLEVHSFSGELLYSKLVSTGDLVIYTEGWNTGSYIITLDDTEGQDVKLFVKN
ncbi:MAG: hypothetical protein ACPG19_12590 [Saprospiraceae bacterium]